MAEDRLRGSIIVITLFDVADEINLARLQPLIGATTASPAFKHPAPEYVRFERPPVVERLAPVELVSGEKFDATLQFYDYGVASLLLRFAFCGTWEQLEQLSARWISSPLFDEVCREIVRRRLDKVRPALIKPYDAWLSEDYYIFHLY